MFHFEDRYFPITEFVELPKYGLFRLVIVLCVRHRDVLRNGRPHYHRFLSTTNPTIMEEVRSSYLKRILNVETLVRERIG
jgi:hypothetical protein